MSCLIIICIQVFCITSAFLSKFFTIDVARSWIAVHTAFAALKADGSITAWDDTDYGGSGTPTDCTYRLDLENPVRQSMLP